MIPIGNSAELPWLILVIGIGGAVSVALYKRRHPAALQMRAAEGGKLGALAGLFGYLLFALAVLISFVLYSGQLQQEITKRMREMPAPDPANQQVYQQLAEKLSTPEGLAFMVTFALAILFVFFLVLGAAGGAIGATLMHRDQRH